MRPSIMWNHLTPRVVLVSSRFPMFFSQFLQVSLCQGQVPHGLHSASLLRPRAPSCAGQRQRAGPGAEREPEAAGQTWPNPKNIRKLWGTWWQGLSWTWWRRLSWTWWRSLSWIWWRGLSWTILPYFYIMTLFHWRLTEHGEISGNWLGIWQNWLSQNGS